MFFQNKSDAKIYINSNSGDHKVFKFQTYDPFKRSFKINKSEKDHFLLFKLLENVFSISKREFKFLNKEF